MFLEKTHIKSIFYTQQRGKSKVLIIMDACGPSPATISISASSTCRTTTSRSSNKGLRKGLRRYPGGKWKRINLTRMMMTMMIMMMACSSKVSSTMGVFGWTAEWMDRSSKTHKISPPRSGHVAFLSDQDVYVFGGYAEERNRDGEEVSRRFPTQDVWKWNPNGDFNGWEPVVLPADMEEKDCILQPQDTPELPQQRLAAAAATLFQNQPIVIGGWDPQIPGTGGVILQDIHKFDPASSKFTKLDIELDQPTSRHVAVTIAESTILIHTHRCKDHVILLEQATRTSSPTLRKQPTKGTAPSPRGLHAACAIGNHVVVLCGAAQDGNMSNDVFALNLDQWEWKPVQITNEKSSTQAPSPRASPCACAVDASSLIVFGGAERTKEGGLQGCNDLWLLQFSSADFTTATWKRLETTSRPPPRNAATLSPLADPPPGITSMSKSSKYFLLAGGWEPFQTTHNDNFILQLNQQSTS